MCHRPHSEMAKFNALHYIVYIIVVIIECMRRYLIHLINYGFIGVNKRKTEIEKKNLCIILRSKG